ncbi:hypothetical protein [Aeromonas salmonicida]|uniref:hypothetical protein n=1 Tax=Aeromonas salmonicida TaxID=645 RepID=UPI003D70510C
MKRFTHDADLRGMVVLRSLGFQLVPFKLHRFRKQRPQTGSRVTEGWRASGAGATPWTRSSVELDALIRESLLCVPSSRPATC